MDTKNRYKEIALRQAFLKYSKYSLKLKYGNLMKQEPISDTKQDLMRDYVSYFEEVLNVLQEEGKFLLKVYTQQINHYQMPISRSNFYYKKRKYNDIFYKYLFEY